MKTALLVITLLASTAACADNYVNGYVRSDGTYVNGYYRSNPNGNQFDNYSSQGNTNPYTGKRGTERSEYSSPPQYNTGSSNTYSNPYGDPYGQSRRRH